MPDYNKNTYHSSNYVAWNLKPRLSFQIHLPTTMYAYVARQQYECATVGEMPAYVLRNNAELLLCWFSKVRFRR